MFSFRISTLFISVALLFVPYAYARAAQPLETETARTLPAGRSEVGLTFERQISSEGTETAAPIAVEYGLSDRVELLLEPVFFTYIRPKTGSSARGAGDLEATLTGRLNDERSFLPALAVAAELKYPTATNLQIGTGVPDYTGYLIASKRIGAFDTHLDVGYTVPGRPDGIALINYWNFAAAGEFRATERMTLMAEVLGNTTSLPDAAEGAPATPESPTTPEASGGETIGMIGATFRLSETVLLAGGVTYDNRHAVLFRPGITFRF